MKNIIVPTDFSPNANNALNFAVEIANLYGSQIHLIHVDYIPSNTGTFASTRQLMFSNAKTEFALLKQEVTLKLKGQAMITTKILDGFPIDVITKYATAYKADLIIMGTQGASGLKEIFLGSKTSGVISISTIPVLAIPSGYQYQPIKDIVLALDSNAIGGKEVMKLLLQLCEAYDAKVNVIHVNKYEEVLNIDHEIAHTLSHIPHNYHRIKANNLNKGIDDFVSKTGANLICMIHRKRNFLDRMLFESGTEKEALHCKVPLLVLFDNQ